VKAAQALGPEVSPGADSADMEPVVGQAGVVVASADVLEVAAVASVGPVFAVVVGSGTEG
jgi:uncharacterized lipoprotein YajG